MIENGNHVIYPHTHPRYGDRQYRLGQTPRILPGRSILDLHSLSWIPDRDGCHTLRVIEINPGF